MQATKSQSNAARETVQKFIGLDSSGRTVTKEMSKHDAECWIASPLTKGAYPGATITDRTMATRFPKSLPECHKLTL